MDDSSAHVFVSYASADRDRALEIADALEAAGVRVWIDRRGISGGSAWPTEVVAAVKGCAALVVLCSPASVASRNVRQELQLAWDHERPILPLMIERVTFPDEVAYFVHGTQWIDILDRPEAGWLPEVLGALGRLGVAAIPSPAAAPADGVTPATSRLPTPLTALLGRDREVREIADLLASHRLVTLTGPGGVGKTRLAIEAARAAGGSFPDGVAFVDLSLVREPDLVIPAVAQALGVREAQGVATADVIASAVGKRQMLVVLDNLEQVLEAAPAVADLLTVCPSLAVLATSRASLAVRGERVVAVATLSASEAMPGRSPDDLKVSPAVALFAARAAEARPGFELSVQNARTIAEICVRLDGLPLAIELAAARIKLLDPAALLARLERPLPALAGGPRDLPERQRTLRDTIAWSHDLLSEAEQTLFRRLGVFVGGFTLEAAEAVANADGNVDVIEGLSSLLDRSLVRREESEATRFRMLETIREFALEQLAESGEEDAVRNAHAAYFIAFCERAETAFFTVEAHAAPIALLEAELGNVRSALGWLEKWGDATSVLRLAGALMLFWYRTGRWSESRAWLERALADGSEVGNAVRAKGLLALAYVAGYQGEPRTVSWLEEAVTLFLAEGMSFWAAIARYRIGTASEDIGDYARARAELAEALEVFRDLGEVTMVPWCLVHLGIVAYGEGDLEAAAALGLEAREAAISLDEAYAVETAALQLGHVACAQGDLAQASAWFVEGMGSSDDAEGLARLAAAIGVLAAAQNESERAARLFGAAEARRAQLGLALALPERAVYEESAEAARQALGAASFDAAWAVGRAMANESVLAEIEATLAEARPSDDVGPARSAPSRS